MIEVEVENRSGIEVDAGQKRLEVRLERGRESRQGIVPLDSPQHDGEEVVGLDMDSEGARDRQRVVVVTGGGGGIGSAAGKLFCGAGAAVALVDLDESAANDAVLRIPE